MKTEVLTEKPFSNKSDETLKIQEDILIEEPKIDEDTAELNGFSSKINNFFEIHNSFLYEDVHENANSLEIYLSRVPSDGKQNMKSACCMNGTYEIETEGENSNSVDSQNIYSSRKRYCASVSSLSPATNSNKTVVIKQSLNNDSGNKKINIDNNNKCRFENDLSDPFQLATNFSANTLSKDSMIDVNYSVEGATSSSQILNEVQKSVPINKKSSMKMLKKRVRIAKKGKTVSQNSNHEKRKERIMDISACDGVVKEESTLDKVLPFNTFPKKDSSFNELLYKIRKREKERQLRVSLTDFLSNCEQFKKQLKEKDDILCFNKAVTLSFPSETNCGNENSLNIKKRKSYRNKSPSSLNQVNVSEKTENKIDLQQDDSNHLNFPEIPYNNDIELEVKSVTKQQKSVKKEIITTEKISQNKRSASKKKAVSPNKSISIKNQTFKSLTVPNEEVGNDTNKKGSGTSQSSITPQRHLDLLQLFDKVKRSSNSEKTFHSDLSVAKLFEKLNESKPVTPKKQIDKYPKYQELEEKHKKSFKEHNLSKADSTDQSDLEIPKTVETKRASTNDVSESELSSRCKRSTVPNEVTPSHSSSIKNSLRQGLRRKTSQDKIDSIQETQERKSVSSLKSEEKPDACSLIQVTEVKSLANWNRKNTQNVAQKEMNHSAFSSSLKDRKSPVALEHSKSNKKSGKRKVCQISSDDSLNLKGRLSKEYISQTGEATSLNTTEKDFTNKISRGSRRKRKRTSENPDFYYTLPSKKRKNIEYREKKSKLKRNGDTNLAIELLPQDTSHDEEKDIDSKNYNFIEEYSSDQNLTHEWYPINPQCYIIRNRENNTTFLGVPIENVNSPTLNQRMISYENRFASSQMTAPVHITPISNFPMSQFVNMAQNTPNVANQNAAAITPNYSTALVPSQNVRASFQLQNVPSIAPSQNIRVMTPTNNTAAIVPSQNASSVIPAQNMITHNSSSVVIKQNTQIGHNVQIGQNAITVTNSHNAHAERCVDLPAAPSLYLPNNTQGKYTVYNVHMKLPSSQTRKKMKLEHFDFDWQLMQKTKDINKTDVYVLAQKYFGGKVNFTVREFCSDPVIIKVLSAQKTECFRNSDLPSRIEYSFHSSSLDEPFIQVLKDFVHFFLKHVYSKIEGKFGEELKAIFFAEVYNKFSLSICILCSKMLPSNSNLSVNDITSALTIVGILVIFCECQNLMKNSDISL